MAERKAKTDVPEKDNQEEKQEEKEVQQTLSDKIVNIRTLRANEIECRIGTINEKGCTLLLYKDARVDMRLLDEVFGPMNWKRDHEVVNGNLFCTISIYDEKKKESELNPIRKRRKVRLPMHSSVPDSTGGLVENFTRHLLFG